MNQITRILLVCLISISANAVETKSQAIAFGAQILPKSLVGLICLETNNFISIARHNSLPSLDKARVLQRYLNTAESHLATVKSQNLFSDNIGNTVVEAIVDGALKDILELRQFVKESRFLKAARRVENIRSLAKFNSRCQTN